MRCAVKNYHYITLTDNERKREREKEKNIPKVQKDKSMDAHILFEHVNGTTQNLQFKLVFHRTFF